MARSIFDPNRATQALQQGANVLERKATSIAQAAVPWASGVIRFGSGFATPRIERSQGMKVSARYDGTGNVVVNFAVPHPAGDFFEVYASLQMPTPASFNLDGKVFAVSRAGFWFNVIDIGVAYANVTTLAGGCFAFRVMQ